jgi:hypothetical protein
VTNGGQADKGATNAKERVSLIADSRSDSTMARETGHFLGALTAEGKYSSEYGHPEKSQDMLMHVHHTGKKIPYSVAPKCIRADLDLSMTNGCERQAASWAGQGGAYFRLETVG